MKIGVKIIVRVGLLESEEISLIGMHVTIGKSKKRWRIRDLSGRCPGLENSVENIRYFAFIGTERPLGMECPVKIISFRMKDFDPDGKAVGNEIAICIDKEKEIVFWVPGPKPPPLTITD